MKENYLLTSEVARTLYEKYARDLPVIDFHNHLSVADMESDRRFKNIYELWIASDPYKHRLMRISGIEERYITGDATDFQKFYAFASVFPTLVGTPVYEWSRMELSMLFGIDEILCEENAEDIYNRVNLLLARDEYSNNGILSRFNIEYQSPVFKLTDELPSFNSSVAPSLRGDDLLMPDDVTVKRLGEKSGIKIEKEEDYLLAISRLLDKFDGMGCRFADHALDDGFFRDEKKRDMLVSLSVEYAKRGWTLLLHLGAKRDTSDRLRSLAGAAGGYAAVGPGFDISALTDMLSDMERAGGLPRVVLFPLNISDMEALAVLSGSFSEDGVASKISLGPAWWWCDHSYGIRRALESVASFGVLSRFIGMTTDSRSVLSFVRHDYFRRVLCSWLVEKNERECWDLDEHALSKLVKKICYENLKERISYGNI